MSSFGQDQSRIGTIHGDEFCERCGYNLRTQAVVGRCTECGNEYDMRRRPAMGILVPGKFKFPTFEVFASLACAIFGGGGLYIAISQKSWSLYLAVPFLAMLVFYVILTVRRAAKYFNHRAVVRSIEHTTR